MKNCREGGKTGKNEFQSNVILFLPSYRQKNSFKLILDTKSQKSSQNQFDEELPGRREKMNFKAIEFPSSRLTGRKNSFKMPSNH